MILSKNSLLVSASTRGPVLFQVVLIVLLAYAAARLTWLVFDGAGSAVSLSYSHNSPIENNASSRHISVHDLVGQNLFGQVQSKPVVEAVSGVAEAIPDTRLRVRLLGVFASDEIDGTRAIIANAAGKERTYSVGDILAGSAVVEEIYSDRVVITHNGNKEVLRILWDGTAVPPGRKVPASTSFGGIPADVAVFRDALFQGADKLKQALGTEAVKEGGVIVGFRVNKAAFRAAARFGVRQGDVLMAVNGIQLDSEASLDNLLKRIPTTQKYKVKLKRHGQVKVITIGR